MRKRIAIVGGGPSALFLFKRLVDRGRSDLTIDIFEREDRLGIGMPYGLNGANSEHITNISCNEIPELATPLVEWLQKLPDEHLRLFDLDRKRFNEYKVLPRLVFGRYLEAEFDLLLERAKRINLPVSVNKNQRVVDVTYDAVNTRVAVDIEGHETVVFDYIIIATGHVWPLHHEGKIPRYFDSPYPPSKLTGNYNHQVAIRGSSLTAVDAIRTLARRHGTFGKNEEGKLSFFPRIDADKFRVVMHSQHGFLPSIRFHVDNPHIDDDLLIPEEEIMAHRSANGGFVLLDYIFERKFKNPLRDKDPDFYRRIQHMKLEEFVGAMLDLREKVHPFVLFKREYEEAAQSIRQHQSIYWKEILSALSFAINYPAKHMSAEDMLRHQKVLMPLISVVIASLPQSSSDELIALYDAGRLDIVAVGSESSVEANPDGGCIYQYEDADGKRVRRSYATYIDGVGQPHLSLDAFPFSSLVRRGSITAATLKFKSSETAKSLQEKMGESIIKKGQDYFLKVPGVAISDEFAVIGQDGKVNDRIYMIAVPYIAGYNPDYSGLDFCEQASKLVIDSLLTKA